MNETLNTAVETAQEVATKVSETNGKKVLLAVLGIASTAIIGTVLYKKFQEKKKNKMLAIAEGEVANEVNEVTDETKSEDEE